MFFEWITGAPPFIDGNAMEIIAKHVRALPVPPRDDEPERPEVLGDQILRLPAKNPMDRPASAAAVTDGLRFARG